jgi:integrase
MRLTQALSSADEQRLISHLTFLPRRDQVLILSCLKLGLRISEILSLRIGDVLAGTSIRPSLTIERRFLKGGRNRRRRGVRSRAIPISPTLRESIQAYLSERSPDTPHCPSEPLFMSRIGHQALRRHQALRIIRGAIIEAGCNPFGNWGCHSLRKTFASRVYKFSGHDVNLTRQALGHSQLQTTLRYLGSDEAGVSEAVLALG